MNRPHLHTPQTPQPLRDISRMDPRFRFSQIFFPVPPGGIVAINKDRNGSPSGSKHIHAAGPCEIRVLGSYRKGGFPGASHGQEARKGQLRGRFKRRVPSVTFCANSTEIAVPERVWEAALHRVESLGSDAWKGLGSCHGSAPNPEARGSLEALEPRPFLGIDQLSPQIATF